MAYFRGDIQSLVLEMETGLTAYLPHDRGREQKQPYRVVYLLHGLWDNATTWTRFSNLEYYASKYNLAVIMPEVQRSFYMDMKNGYDYFRYVSEELPMLCQRMFHISDSREDTFVAGVSMGGYGALKCALAHPERYAAVAAFSAVCDVAEFVEQARQGIRGKDFKGPFGEALELEQKDDLFHLATECAQKTVAERPRILMCCGQSDFLHNHNVRMREHLKALGYDLTYREWPGEHEWGFFNEALREGIDYFGQMK